MAKAKKKDVIEYPKVSAADAKRNRAIRTKKLLEKRQRRGIIPPRASTVKASGTREASDLVRTLREEFGAVVNTKDGKLPAGDKKQQLLLQTMAKVKGISQEIVIRTVTLSLKKGLSRDAPADFPSRISEAAVYVGKLRYICWLFANYLYFDAIENGTVPPEPTDSFFKECFTSIRSSDDRWRAFADATGYSAPPDVAFGVDQFLVWTARDMATATSTRMKYNFEKRRTSIIKWALRSIYRRTGVPAGHSKDEIATAIHRIAACITRMTASPESEEQEDLWQEDGASFEELGQLACDLEWGEHWHDIMMLYAHEVSFFFMS